MVADITSQGVTGIMQATAGTSDGKIVMSAKLGFTYECFDCGHKQVVTGGKLQDGCCRSLMIKKWDDVERATEFSHASSVEWDIRIRQRKALYLVDVRGEKQQGISRIQTLKQLANQSQISLCNTDVSVARARAHADTLGRQWA